MRCRARFVIPMVVLAAVLGVWPGALWAAEGSEGQASEDLANVQGMWERRTGHDVPGLKWATKEIHGNHEVITYYGADNQVLSAHEVDFKLQRVDGIKVFTYFNWVATAGPQKGHKSTGVVSYIYRVDENTYIEVWGFTPRQETRPPLVMIWVRRPTLTEDMRRQQDLLQGTWQPVSRMLGNPSAADWMGAELSFDGDEFATRKEGQLHVQGAFRVHPEKSPMAIDFIITQSPNGMWNGQVVHGVYAIEGGQLKLCAAAPTAPRPQKLEVIQGSTQTMAVLKKAGPPGRQDGR